MTERAKFIQKIEDELRKPSSEQKQQLLDFWRRQLDKIPVVSKEAVVVPHYRMLICGVRKLNIAVKLYNELRSLCIELLLQIDGECGAGDLVLQLEDIEKLGLSKVGPILKGVQSDGSVVALQEYERVVMELVTEVGEIIIATLSPVCVVQEEEAATKDAVVGIPGAEDTTRLLCCGSLHRLGLKQDFTTKRLVKVLRRI